MSFADQLARSRSGDRSALQELFDRWRPLLRLVARKVLGSVLSARIDPSDIVQESLLQASRSLEQFRGQSQGEWVAWLKTIVCHQARNLKRLHRSPKRDLAREEGSPEEAWPSPAAGPLQQLIDAEDAGRLAEAIEALPGPKREVLIRRVLERKKVAEIAQELGEKPNTIQQRLGRALRDLQKVLQSKEELP